MPHDPPAQGPVPVSAVWDGGWETRITFDMALQPVGSLDVNAWKLRYGPGPTQFERPDHGSASGNEVALFAFSAVSLTHVEYDPPPFQVVGAPPNDQPAQPFSMDL